MIQGDRLMSSEYDPGDETKFVQVVSRASSVSRARKSSVSRRKQNSSFAVTAVQSHREACVCAFWNLGSSASWKPLSKMPVENRILVSRRHIAQRLPISPGVLCFRIAAFPSTSTGYRQVRVNTSAVERRAQSHTARRTVKKEWQAAWLLRAITCMDLTTLSGDDTDERVRRLMRQSAGSLFSRNWFKKLGIEELQIKVAAVCVYHRFVETALRALEGSGVRVAAVSTGFPAGLIAAGRESGRNSPLGRSWRA